MKYRARKLKRQNNLPFTANAGDTHPVAAMNLVLASGSLI